MHAFHLAGVLQTFVSTPAAPDPVRVRAVIEMRHADSGRLWVEHVQHIEAVQLPMAFNVRMTPPHPAPGPMRLRGALIEADGDAWVSEERLVQQWPDTIELGTLHLTWQPFLAFASSFDCDGQPVSMGIRQNATWLRSEGALVRLQAHPVGQTRRWRGDGDTEVDVSDVPRIRINGRTLTGCRLNASP